MNNSKSNTIKSLEKQLGATKDIRERIDLLNLLAQTTSKPPFSNLTKAIALSEVANELADQLETEKKPYRKGLVESLQCLGEFYIQLSHYDMALSFLIKAEASLKKISLEDDVQALDENNVLQIARAAILNAIGIAYTFLGEYSSALEAYLASLEIYQRFHIELKQANVLNNIGGMYLLLKENVQALDYLEQSLRLTSKYSSDQIEARETSTQDVDEIQATTFDKLCAAHFRLNKQTEALEFGLGSLRIYRETGNIKGLAEALSSLSDVYLAKKNDKEALSCLVTALEIVQTSGSNHQEAIVHLKLGNLFRHIKDFPQAIDHLLKANQFAKEANAKQTLYESHRALAGAFKDSGDFEKSLYHFETFYSIRREVFNQEATNRLKNLEIVHQVENSRKEAEISQLKNVRLQNEIKDRLLAEQTLRETNLALQHEIADKEQLIGDLNAFSYMVAHDLKTPLTNIALSSGILRAQLIKDSFPRLSHESPDHLPLYQEHIDRVIWMVDKMNRIINELLVLASIRKEDIYLHSLDMVEIIQDVETRMAHKIDESHAEIIKPSTWPIVLGHAPWVEEVWANYISNALTYGGTPPRIELGFDEVQCEYEKGTEDIGKRMFRFWVKDNGNGLNEAAQASLFAPLKSTSVIQPKGHGLGLTIVRRIVEKLGGQVGVESSGIPGEGSTFYFLLPAINMQQPQN